MKFSNDFWFPDSETHFIEYLNSFGEYQPKPKNELEKIVKDWSCVIDIGSHVGTWAVWFAKRAKVVHCFEPINTNFDCLVKNLENFENCYVYPYAVSNTSEMIKMYKPVKLSNTGTYSPNPMEGWEEINVRSIRIDDLNLTPTVIKLDIQGGELEALRGAENTIRIYRPVICCEESTDKKDNVRDIEKFMDAIGYRKVFKHKEDAIYTDLYYARQ